MSVEEENGGESPGWNKGESEWETVNEDGSGGPPAPYQPDGPAGGRATAALILGIIGLAFVVFNGCCCGVGSVIGIVL